MMRTGVLCRSPFAAFFIPLLCASVACRMSILSCLDNRSKRSWALVFAIVVLLVVCAAAAADDDDGEVAPNVVFVPTREWQAIPRGVAIPPGLHIRVDLTTGERHAKLIDSNDQTPPSNETEAVMVPATKSPEEVSKVDAARLTKEKVLMKLPDRELADMGLDFTKARAELSNDEYWALIEQKWAERQALIQKVYDLMLKPAEVLAELIANISTPHNKTLRGMRVALEQLEDFLTDIDMARDFYTLGGWPRLVALLGPEHHSEVRWRAAWAVGNAVKNDHIFQRWILEAHGQRETPLSKLLAIVEEGPKTVQHEGAEGLVGDERNGAPDELLRKAVYAITSASRGNSVVQARLLQEGGMDTLASLLGAPFASLPLRVKVATFGTDMLTEVGHAVEGGQDAAALEQAVTSQRWCEGSLALLHDVGHDPVSTEKVLLSLEAMKDRCEGTGHIDAGRLQETVSSLRDLYSSEGEGERPFLIREMERPYREELVARMDRLAGGGPVPLREEL